MQLQFFKDIHMMKLFGILYFLVLTIYFAKVSGITELIVYESQSASIEENTTVRYSLEEASSFMRERCSSINQTLMSAKTGYINNIKVFYFLSVSDETGQSCISAVSELQLKVISVDCGATQIKINQWKNL